jgi:hypothetical protein
MTPTTDAILLAVHVYRQGANEDDELDAASSTGAALEARGRRILRACLRHHRATEGHSSSTGNTPHISAGQRGGHRGDSV